MSQIYAPPTRGCSLFIIARAYRYSSRLDCCTRRYILSIVSVFLLLCRENRYNLFKRQLRDWWPSQYKLKTVLVDAFITTVVYKEIHLFILSPPSLILESDRPFTYWRDETE